MSTDFVVSLTYVKSINTQIASLFGDGKAIFVETTRCSECLRNWSIPVLFAVVAFAAVRL